MFYRHRRLFTILALPYLILIVLLVVRTDARAYVPGDLVPIDEVITLEGEHVHETDAFHSIYVMGVDRPTFFQRGVAFFDGNVIIDDLPEHREGLSDREIFTANQISRQSATHAAIIASFKAAGRTIDYEPFDTVRLVYPFADTTLRQEDELLAVNEEDDVRKALEEAETGQMHTAKVLRDGEETAAELYRHADGMYGLSLARQYRITSSEVSFKVHASLIGGPSGGLMQALDLYNRLSEEDLTQSRVIAGTGTIDAEGRVGAIGGVREKLITAVDKNADIFFIPEGDNHDTALDVKREKDFDIEIIAVDSLHSAIEGLKEGEHE